MTTVVIQITSPTTVIRPTVQTIVLHNGPTIVTGGGGSDTFKFTFTQDIASALWTITHELDGFPNVTVVDTLGRQVEADVAYVDANHITVGFASPATGAAYLS